MASESLKTPKKRLPDVHHPRQSQGVFWPFALALVTASAAPEAAPSERLVDRVVAEVGGTVITLSELEFETRLVLLKARGPEVAWAARLEPELLSAVLHSIVHRELLLAEVRRLQLRDPDPEIVDRAADELESRFVSAGDFSRFLERVGIKDAQDTQRVPAALAAILKAELLVERFLDVRIRLNTDPTREEVRACFDKNASKLGGRSFETLRERIAQRIREEREQRALESLVEQLAKRTEVVYLQPFEPPDPDREKVENLELSCLN